MRERPLEGPRRTSGKGTQLLGSGTAGEGTGNRTEPPVHPLLPHAPPGRPPTAGPCRTPARAALLLALGLRAPLTQLLPPPRAAGAPGRTAGQPGSLRAPECRWEGGPGRPPAGRRSPSTDPAQMAVKGSRSCRGQRSRRRGRPLLIPMAPVPLPGPAVVGEAVRDPEATLPGGREVKAGEGGFRVNRDETDTKRRPPGTETAGGGLSTHSGSSLPLSSSECCFSLVFPKLARAQI